VIVIEQLPDIEQPPHGSESMDESINQMAVHYTGAPVSIHISYGPFFYTDLGVNTLFEVRRSRMAMHDTRCTVLGYSHQMGASS